MTIRDFYLVFAFDGDPEDYVDLLYEKGFDDCVQGRLGISGSFERVLDLVYRKIEKYHE